jgi:excisionase family DNA binding protein
VTIKQAAEYYQLDPKTTRRMIAQGKLKARRVRSLFLLTADLRNRPPATLTERGKPRQSTRGRSLSGWLGRLRPSSQLAGHFIEASA